MTPCNKTYYVRICLTNSNKNKPPIFNWSGGNIAFAIALAKEEVSRKVPIDNESHYSIDIKIKNDQTNATEYLWENKQGHVREAVDMAEGFINNKLGISLKRCVQYSIEQEKRLNA